jgi:DNA polymerase-3 subunit gamma/tau
VLKEQEGQAISAPKVEKIVEQSVSKPPVAKSPVVPSAGPKSISIKDALAGKVQIPIKHEIEQPEIDESASDDFEEVDYLTDEDTPFSQVELDTQWQNYIQSNLADKPRSASLLANYSPLIGSNYRITLEVESQFQVDMFNEIKNDLLAFLKRKLENKSISLEVVEQSQDNGKNKIYTVEDKFKYLSQINPTMLKLKQQLGLDFD